MRPVPNMEFVLQDFEKLNNEFHHFPRGVLMEVSINPFNGTVFVNTQKTEECKNLLRSIFEQIKQIRTPKQNIRRFKQLFLFDEVA